MLTNPDPGAAGAATQETILTGPEGQGAEQRDEAPGSTTEQTGGEKRAPEWMSQLKGNLKESESLGGFGTVSDLAGAYLDLAGKADGMVHVPGENATPEEQAAFRTALGVPEKPEDYELAKPSEWPEALPWPEQSVSAFRAAAHEIGIPKAQAEALFNKQNEQAVALAKQMIEQRIEQKRKAVNELRSKWGSEYDERVKLVQRVFRGLGDDELVEAMVRTGAADEPAVVRAFYRIYEKVGDDTWLQGSTDRARESSLYPNTDFSA